MSGRFCGRRLAASTLLLLTLIGAAPSAGGSATPLSMPLPAQAADAIARTAEDLFVRTGVKPFEVELYATEESTAMTAVGTPQPTAGGTPVYVLVYRGDFELKIFRGPFGATPPRGTIAVYVVDAQTGDGRCFGVQSRPVDQRALGPMIVVPIG